MASTGVRYHVANIAVYHIVKVTVTMTRHIMVIAMHIAIQKMYLPKSPKNDVKSQNTRNTRTLSILILKYTHTHTYILFLER